MSGAGSVQPRNGHATPQRLRPIRNRRPYRTDQGGEVQSGGRRAGGRRLLPDDEELTGEEVAPHEVGGVVVCTLPADTWETVVEHGLWAAVLDAAEGR